VFRRSLARRRLRRNPPPVARQEEIDARLELFFDELDELSARGGDLDVDEAVAHACARAEEWTA
jgi:hypothetical protein